MKYISFKALYICDAYPRASAKPNSHTSSLSRLLEKYCTPYTLYWPVNCGIKKKYNSCQAAANTRHCSLRDLSRKYKSLHLMAWLYKHSLHGVYFRIQGHKICQWLPRRNSPWGHFILRSNAFNFQGLHDNEPNVLWWWRADCIPDIPESFYFCIYIFKKWQSYVVCSVYGNQTQKGGGKTGRGKEKWVWKSIWELLLASTLPFCQLVRRWYHAAER